MAFRAIGAPSNFPPSKPDDAFGPGSAHHPGGPLSCRPLGRGECSFPVTSRAAFEPPFFVPPITDLAAAVDAAALGGLVIGP